jgi:hypothetical protein
MPLGATPRIASECSPLELIRASAAAHSSDGPRRRRSPYKYPWLLEPMTEPTIHGRTKSRYPITDQDYAHVLRGTVPDHDDTAGRGPQAGLTDFDLKSRRAQPSTPNRGY